MPAGGPATLAGEAVARVSEMFHVDGKLAGLGPEARAEARGRLLRPLMDSFSEWLEAVAPTVMPDTPLAKAVTYARGQLPYLYNALDDGRLPLDNNRAERAIRPFAVGRRAWLFSDTPAGAEASCGVYSVVTTARANGPQEVSKASLVAGRVLLAMEGEVSKLGDEYGEYVRDHATDVCEALRYDPVTLVWMAGEDLFTRDAAAEVASECSSRGLLEAAAVLLAAASQISGKR